VADSFVSYSRSDKARVAPRVAPLVAPLELTLLPEEKRALEFDLSYAAPWATMAIAQWDMHRRSDLRA
jgi:hypothetical protein